MPEIVEQIGSYAGFAAVLGLAVLSALYFSQARDVKRLREWAGRAPEREPAEKAAIQARAQASAQAAQQRLQSQPQSPQPQPQPQQPTPAAKPAPASAAAAATATSAPPAAAGAKPPAAQPAAANGGPGGPGKAPPLGGTPRVPAAQQTAILPPSAKARPPWYRRVGLPEPRYTALIVAGILIVGGGAAFGITQLGQEDTPSTPAAAGQDGGAAGEGAQAQSGAPPSPADITVSVLNGTTVTGLASQFQDALAEAGYDVGNAANFSDQAKAESVVMYAEGARPAARVVATDLDISQIERVDAESQTLGGNASVIVVLGADKTP